MSVTREYLLDIFDVDLELGRLIWRKPSKYHPDLRGQEAGTSQESHNGKLYWVIRIDKRGYKRGRLIYLIVHGQWPSPCLDHQDGNSLNDRPDNLRAATITENAQNHKRRARRANLPMGVRLIPASGRFQARISLNGQQIHLGAYDTPTEAHGVYLAKRKELFREFA